MTGRTDIAEAAYLPRPVESRFVNRSCFLPYGLAVDHVISAMADFVEFLGFINVEITSRGIPPLETFLMPANFSSIVGEFMNASIPKYCSTLVKNRYHNGHPDLLPVGLFPDNAAQHTSNGIEVKASRHMGGWQGHNAEAVWLMIFCFDSTTSLDSQKGTAPKPFGFRAVYAAQLDEQDWSFSGRSETSRQTITASVNQRGVEKMRANWIYSDSIPGS